ncbi:MAG: hypothetical protein JEZ03_04985 [Bacteroidales bacterium]|nr:hypothetical protein [Bacteroidales bacterium]
MKKLLLITTLAFLSLLTIYSCKKDEFITGNDAVLNFSSDTILFDTVFTSLGSSRRQLTIYNPHDKKINISSIKLAGGERSPYRINIDGESTLEMKDYELAANDSLFIQVQVTINPTDANNPFIIKDSILFHTDANIQDVNLVAYGQNAHFHANELLVGQHLWEADKPHIVYGFVIVDDSLNSSLSIAPGCQIYMHSNAMIAVDSSASLKIYGTTESPVTVQGDRLEDWYNDIPGQWGMIWLAAGSKENYISNATIKNGTIGVRADTLGASSEPTLIINNSRIENMLGHGLLGQGTSIEASNCVFGNCGKYEVVLALGGEYNFRNCTMGNYWSNGNGAAGLAMNNYYIYEYDTIPRDITNAYFGNCIIYGTAKNEIIIDKTTLAELNYSFDHCLLKIEYKIDESEYFNNCLKTNEIYFHNPTLGDFRLDTIASPAVNAGSMNVIQDYPYNDLSKDINGINRIADGQPDLGAYEFQLIED